MKNLRVKPIFRLDTIQRHYRLFRVMWEVGTVGDGHGHSNMVSVAVQPKFFLWEHNGGSWMVVLFGVRIHRKRSFGGIFA